MRKILTAIFAATLLASPGFTASASGAIAGRVLPDPSGPAPTAVWVAPWDAQSAGFRVPVARDGSFATGGMPAGAVELAVETTDGLYVVSTPVTIAPGTTRHLQLAIGGRQDSSPSTEPPKKSRRQGGVWANPVYATLIVVGAAVVLGVGVAALTEPDDPTTTPASPTNP